MSKCINSVSLLVACNVLSGIAIILQFIASFPTVSIYIVVSGGLAIASIMVAIWQGIQANKEQKSEIEKAAIAERKISEKEVGDVAFRTHLLYLFCLCALGWAWAFRREIFTLLKSDKA